MLEKKKIGEILIENRLITKEMLDEALEYQKNFGGSLTQYLIACGYIEEEELARSLSQQFRYPYLPLRAYDVPESIIDLIPPEVARKYLLVPVDKIENIVTIVMSDPLDEEAIREVERATNCKAQPFVGIISDILRAIERYYKVRIMETDLKKGKAPVPLFITTKAHTGAEQRRSIRIKANISVHFPDQDIYRKSHTKDVSRHGFLFESSNILPLDSYIVLEINLPRDMSPYPIAAVVQVARVLERPDKKFDVGVRAVKMMKEDADKVIRYALTTSCS